MACTSPLYIRIFVVVCNLVTVEWISISQCRENHCSYLANSNNFQSHKSLLFIRLPVKTWWQLVLERAKRKDGWIDPFKEILTKRIYQNVSIMRRIFFSFIFWILYVHALLLWSHPHTPHSLPCPFFKEESKTEMLMWYDELIRFFLKNKRTTP